MTIFHIRARTVEQQTLCGAKTTIHDEPFFSGKVRPTRGFKPCERCMQLRLEERQVMREKLRHLQPH